MSQVRMHHQNRNRVRLGYEEEKAWRGFYHNVRNPDVAMEILKELDADAEMKRAHLALYMSCKQTQRIDKSRKARNQRIGQFVRWLADKFCMAPWRVIMGGLRGSRDVAVECLPEVRKEPATRQIGQLARDAEFKQEKAAFNGEPSVKVESSSKEETSGKSKSPAKGESPAKGDSPAATTAASNTAE